MTVKEHGVMVGELRHASAGSVAGNLLPGLCDAICIEPVQALAVINLRGRPDDPEFLSAINKVTGVDLPVEPNTWKGDSGCRAAIWLGPDEWLILAADGEAASLEENVRASLPEDPWLSVADLSHNYTTLRLSGSRTRDLLAKGCPLDLHPQAFSAGCCAQTFLAKTGVLLRAVDSAGAYEIWFRNSFAVYTISWLLDAAAEFHKR